MLAYVLLLAAGGFLLLPEHVGLFFGYIVILVAVLIIVCLLKGEKPRWRWGKD